MLRRIERKKSLCDELFCDELYGHHENILTQVLKERLVSDEPYILNLV